MASGAFWNTSAFSRRIAEVAASGSSGVAGLASQFVLTETLLPLTPPRTPIRRSRWLTQKWFGAASFGTAGGNYTFGQVATLEAPFEAIQLIVGNPTTSPMTYDAFGIAAQATLSGPNGFAVPVDGSGAVQGFTPVTWGGAAAAVIPAGTAAQPTYLISDPIPLESIARSDGGTLPLLNIRTFISTPSSMLSLIQVAAFNANRLQGRCVHDYLVQGSNAIASAAVQPKNLDVGYMPVVGIRYLSTRTGVTLMAMGDSLTQGQFTSSQFNAWGLKAAEILSTPLAPVSFANEGVGGQTTDVFQARGRTAIALYNPDIVAIPPWSPNNQEGVSGSNRLGMLAQALETAAIAEAAGATPIIETAWPWAGVATSASEITTSGIVRSLTDATNRVLDVQKILLGGIPQVGAQIQMPVPYSAYPVPGSQVNVHLNDTGTLVIGQALAAMLRPDLIAGIL